jgi:ATP-dependent protease HslVU (ClpYQ) peptidase subunit
MKNLTCIVGLVQDGVVYIGGDSAGVAGMDIKVRLDPKVFIVDKRFIIGYTDSFRMGQLLRFSLKPPRQKPRVDDYEYMCTGFINAVRRCFTNGGYIKKQEERERGGSFLVGYRGRLYEIASDFQVGINADSYSAIGCGEDYAHGSLFATEHSGLSPEERIRLALEAASHFSAGVHPPFVIIRLPVR